MSCVKHFSVFVYLLLFSRRYASDRMAAVISSAIFLDNFSEILDIDGNNVKVNGKQRESVKSFCEWRSTELRKAT